MKLPTDEELAHTAIRVLRELSDPSISDAVVRGDAAYICEQVIAKYIESNKGDRNERTDTDN